MMLKVSGIFAAALLLAQPALSQVVTQQKPSAYCETPPYTGQGGKNCHSVWDNFDHSRRTRGVHDRMAG
jgi:hypothetical protein